MKNRIGSFFFKHSPLYKKITIALLSIYCFLLPFEFVASIGKNSIIKYVAIVVFVFAFLFLLSRKKLPKINLHIFLFLLAYLFQYGLSIIYTKSKSDWIYFYPIMLRNVFFILTISLIDLDREEQNPIFVSMIVSSLIASFYLFFFFKSGLTSRRTIDAFGSYIDNNYLGGILFTSLVILYYYVFNRVKKRPYLIALGIAALIIVVAIILTGSRTAIVAIIVSIFILSIYYMIFKKKFFVILIAWAAIFLAYGLMMFILPQSLASRFWIPNMLALDGSDGGGDRIEIWLKTIPAFFEKPFLGFGGGSSSYVTNLYYGRSRALHNFYLDLLIELGIVGLLNMLSCFLVLAVWSFKKKNSIATIIIFTIVVYSAFLSPASIKFFWLLFWLYSLFIKIKPNIKDILLYKEATI